MSSEVVFEDGTPVPDVLTQRLPFVNEGDTVVLVWTDGKTHTGYVFRNGPGGTRWWVDALPLMTCEYAPFKVTVHERNLLTLVNISLAEKVAS